MITKTAKKLVPIPLIDQEAIKLVRQRAEREHRSRSNALTLTVIEALGDMDTPADHVNGTQRGGNTQANLGGGFPGRAESEG